MIGLFLGTATAQDVLGSIPWPSTSMPGYAHSSAVIKMSPDRQHLLTLSTESVPLVENHCAKKKITEIENNLLVVGDSH